MAPFLFAQAYQTGSPRNYGQYSNPVVDEVIGKAKTATNEKDALKYWKEFQKLVTEDVANIWLCNIKALAAIRNNVKGVVVMASPGIVLLDKAYIEWKDFFEMASDQP